MNKTLALIAALGLVASPAFAIEPSKETVAVPATAASDTAVITDKEISKDAKDAVKATKEEVKDVAKDTKAEGKDKLAPAAGGKHSSKHVKKETVETELKNGKKSVEIEKKETIKEETK